jgi:hypothetical protein
MLNNPTCQHRKIDNDTAKCVDCQESMILIKWNADTVVSADNAAACHNPACQEALDAGTYDEIDPPVGCTNPNGTYIPMQPHEVVLGYFMEYECVRCAQGGTTVTYDKDGIKWPCGGIHRGDYKGANSQALSS